MADSTIGPSLLPYLNGHPAGLSIQLVLPEQLGPIKGDAEDSLGPFSLLRNGRMVVDGQHRLVDLMFVTQPDGYSGVRSELRPWTNLDVESIWQHTWAQIKNRHDETGPTVLPCQIDEKGALAPFRSVFHCTHKNVYCHPLCPICGTPLALCCNDDLLKAAGLPAYSKSLQRYLYCADCHQKTDEASFYTRDSKGSALSRVKDSHALIKAFSCLLTKSDLADPLPCIGCTEAGKCYGPGAPVLNRMQPLQFYPFHLLMQHAPTLNALEFLALVSGCQARKFSQEQKCGFLFKQDDRLFLEILYLKLSFLQELIALISSDVFTLVGRMSLKAIGVDMHIQGAHLPHIWNFALRLINPVGMPARHLPGSTLPQALIYEFLGHAWFYVLLVNGTQQMTQINAVIDEQWVKDSNLEMPTKALLKHVAFDPGNIFWQPRSIELAPDWHAVWIEALEQGMTLLCAGSNGVSEFAPGVLEVRLEELKNRVHQYLFQAPAIVNKPADETSNKTANKTANDTKARIANMLTNILELWPQAADLSKKEPSQAAQKSPFNLSKTVVLTTPQTPAAREDLAETVLISPSGGQLAAPDTASMGNAAGADQPQKPVKEELAKTVIISTGKGATGKAGS